MEKISHIIGGQKDLKKHTFQALRIGALVNQKKKCKFKDKKIIYLEEDNMSQLCHRKR